MDVLSRNVWKDKYRFLDLGSGEEILHFHEIDLDEKMLENPLYEEGDIPDYTDDSESGIFNNFASGIEISDIDEDASIDTEYLELSTDLDDFDEEFDIDEDIEELLNDLQ